MKDLEIELGKLNVPESSYNLNGASIPNNITMFHSKNGWIVQGFNERGKNIDQKFFYSEEEACLYIYDSFKRIYDYDKRDTVTIARILSKRPHLDLILQNKFFNSLNFRLPTQFEDFYKTYNGLEGRVGQHSWIKFWPVDLIMRRNNDSNNLLGGYLLFGENKDGTEYAFGKAEPGIFEIKYFTNKEGFEVNFCVQDFDELLLYLYDK